MTKRCEYLRDMVQQHEQLLSRLALLAAVSFSSLSLSRC